MEKYPDVLYVREKEAYPFLVSGSMHLVGERTLESAVPDNDRDNVVAVYQLVGVNNYRKTVTRTSVVEQVSDKEKS